MSQKLGTWLEMFNMGEINHLLEFLKKENIKTPELITPSPWKIFEPFQECSLWDLKVIMIGSEPDFNKSKSPGVLFSEDVEDGVPYSKEMEYIIDSLSKESAWNQESLAFDPSMKHWMDQGVLMTHRSLTAKRGDPLAHMDMWENIMNQFIGKLSKEMLSLNFILFGDHAHSLERFIQKYKGHSIIKLDSIEELTMKESPDLSYAFDEIDYNLGRNYETIEWYYEEKTIGSHRPISF